MKIRPRSGVAVIIPVHRAGFLEDALDSVLSQTRAADEVIVIDDGSPDREVLERAIEARHGRIRLVRQANAGAGAARNAGIAMTTCPWVAFLDADDWWEPDCLERQVEFLARHGDVDLVWADATIVGDTPVAGQTFMSMCPSTGPVTLERLLGQTCNVLTSTVVVKRSLVLAAGGFDVNLRRGQDFDLWLRLVAAGARAAYQRHVLAARRLHGENLSGTRLTELERALHVFNKTLTSLPLTASERDTAWQRIRTLRGEHARELGKARLRAGDFAAARHLLEEAQRQASSWKVRATQLGLAAAPELVRRLYLARLGTIQARGVSPRQAVDQAAQPPSRKSVKATSTLLRSACLIAGQFFSHRTSVFHE